MPRKSGYNSEFHDPWVKSLARRGLILDEIADEIGVARSTLCKWVDENESLSDALKEGKSKADSAVEDSLYRRALGYTYSEKKTLVSAGGNGEQKPVKVEVVEKTVPPDTTACIFWLKNRMPKVWRDRTNIALEAEDADTVKIQAEIKAVFEALKADDEE